MLFEVTPFSVFSAIAVVSVVLLIFLMLRSRDSSVVVNSIAVMLFILAVTGMSVTNPIEPPKRDCRYIPKSAWHKYSHCGSHDVEHGKQQNQQ